MLNLLTTDIKVFQDGSALKNDIGLDGQLHRAQF